jgi:hypothetical protein
MAVISHDAGGAEILSSYVKKSGAECLFTLDGPAIKIFERKLGELVLCSLESSIAHADLVVCGTSWQSDLECDAIKLARKKNKSSVAYLDHWVNYEARFLRSGEATLPDEIWVGDSWGKTLADRVFSDIPVLLKPNPYFTEVLEELSRMERLCNGAQYDRTALNFLYVCEPISEHAQLRYGNTHHWGYVEQEAMIFFLESVKQIESNLGNIVVRLHPSEKVGKYDDLLLGFDLPISVSTEAMLLEDIAKCHVVVGCESMAMVIALMAGKKVASSIPVGGRACVLPHDGITKLNGLVKEDWQNWLIEEGKV